MLPEKVMAAVSGVVAGIAAAVGAEENGISLGVSVVISLVTSALVGGSLYGALRSSLTGAHRRISDEEQDRKAAVAELKADMNRGFDRLERTTEQQTTQIIAALRRPADARTRMEDDA